MNVVFVTDNCVNPTLGGIDRITYVVAAALHKDYGYSCFSVFAREKNECPERDKVFTDIHQWKSKNAFLEFVREIGDCVIVLQSPCTIAKGVLEAKSELNDVKLVNVFHATPGFEIISLDWSIIKYRLLHNIDRKATLKQSVIQVVKALLPRNISRILQKKYSRPYGVADKMVVLSKGIIEQYQAIAPCKNIDFEVIPNILSFDQIQIPPKKNKEVLIVARLDDWHKRIFDAIKIWEKVQADSSYQDWILKIVGDGIDRSFYEEYTKKHKIPNIRFEGQQMSLPYYQRAELFMMTSACEGFPMTLLEAQQNGCVPVVFDTFASLSDVVTDGRNGFVVPEGDKDEYVARLTQLMKDESLRKEMAENAIKDSQRFAPEKVVKQWHKLFTELVKEN